jgi:hypothetical protein
MRPKNCWSEKKGIQISRAHCDVGDITDVVATLKRITLDIHRTIMERYAPRLADPSEPLP